MTKLYENDNYVVVTGDVQGEGRVLQGYHAVNKRTSVVEYEDTVLPSIISFAESASNHLDELLGAEPKAACCERLN